MRRALRACVEPIAASAGTVIAGLLCLLLSDLGSNRSLGPVAAIGIASALLGALTLLPALLLVVGQRSRVLFWPRAPRTPDAPRRRRRTPQRPSRPPTPTPPRAGALGPPRARSSARTPARCGSSRPLVLCVGAAFLPTLKASGTSQTDVFLTDVDSVAGEDVLAEHFPAGAVQPAIVIVDRGRRRRRRRPRPRASTASTSVAPYTGAPAGARARDAGRRRRSSSTGACASTSRRRRPPTPRRRSRTVEDLRDAVHDGSPRRARRRRRRARRSTPSWPARATCG